MTAAVVVLAGRWTHGRPAADGQDWVAWDDLDDAERAAVRAVFGGRFRRPPVAVQLATRTEQGAIR